MSRRSCRPRFQREDSIVRGRVLRVRRVGEQIVHPAVLAERLRALALVVEPVLVPDGTRAKDGASTTWTRGTCASRRRRRRRRRRWFSRAPRGAASSRKPPRADAASVAPRPGSADADVRRRRVARRPHELEVRGVVPVHAHDVVLPVHALHRDELPLLEGGEELLLLLERALLQSSVTSGGRGGSSRLT